ncbi:2,3,4,5-tetrahydropyridine-2,6-dicarboxylate N-succinyltransferase [Enterobacteriaceae endosymbiont of Donacia bicoloricornis]|uniref:2,3,4,5-tetrahydropyridine-2,6-dicarboxylate N-succinyltransferase n=1 Tax=Enterobacteriaceae endosymbiont of Donacia bicoloricornis TaxID=2675772 RepID=UPI0014496FF8|nr:2,3,4,5-tetrahydropyridine-2,6-dicarboxylate N-succinyltransferase [Enterobacteriaceae endosymbiont of Donacia bicoloricornis]QJC37576.1 2,3,4,5-tetrahydropyridine-2,6-dicarboxylate N-succinyltransferase [Enterobacteriaceae endosymbiont of Donacia bicoloricornis]
MKYFRDIIENYFSEYKNNNNLLKDKKVINNINKVISFLDNGIIRVSKNIKGNWVVYEWIKKAILLYFKINKNFLLKGTYNNFYDKIPLKFNSNFKKKKFKKIGCRVVPPTIVRFGSFISDKVILMPSFVNIGAFIGKNTMIDTWSTIGSCAQIGDNVHISGGVGIGGVLEPIQSSPTIIEDNCFIGARSEIVEGVIVKKGSVISMGVYIGQSTKIYDRETGSINYGIIPSYSVVVPGTLPSKDGKYNLYCVIIVKKVDKKTLSKTAINNILREF